MSVEGQWSDWDDLILCHKQITVSALLFCCSCEIEVDKQPCHLQRLRQAWSHRCCPTPSPVHPAALTAVTALNVTRRHRFFHDYPQAEDITISESPLVCVCVASLSGFRPQVCWLRKLLSKSRAFCPNWTCRLTCKSMHKKSHKDKNTAIKDTKCIFQSGLWPAVIVHKIKQPTCAELNTEQQLTHSLSPAGHFLFIRGIQKLPIIS